jgi:hypothetical protein
MKVRALAAACAIGLVLAAGGPARAQTQHPMPQNTQAGAVEMAANGSTTRRNALTKRLLLSTAVGMVSGGILFNRAFRTVPATIAGVAVMGLALPGWVLFSQSSED